MIIGLVVLVGAASAGQFTFGLDVDTYIYSANATKSFSSEDLLWATSSDGVPINETYMGFINNFATSNVFSPKDIESATLKVHVAKVERPGKVTAYFVHGPTLESLTWNDRPEYDKSASSTIAVSKEGDYTLDGTEIVKKAVETCAEGCGFSLVLVADGNASIGFSSSRDTGAGGAKLSYVTPE